MTRPHPILFLALLVLAAPAAADTVTHALAVTLSPEDGRLAVEDRVTLPAGVAPRFTLHAGLQPRLVAPAGTLRRVGRTRAEVPLETWEARLPEGATRLTLRYAGRIVHPPAGGRAADGARAGSPGLIAPEGVYLDPAAHWYPHFAAPVVDFVLEVHGPAGWRAVSQGEPLDRPGTLGAWRETRPQPGIWLVANRFHEYARDTPHGRAQVFLRRAEPALAQTYLAATAEYLALYARLIGPYPYAKFALVENVWESGWGMPSFTLLGPRVLRLPFIPRTSYPHEILHSWWGNGVYPDPDGGNWTEGLTTYLADHLLAARRGGAAEYRRSVLQQYADYADRAEELALAGFRSRHGGLSQAVGYGKGMMLFHMLRTTLGDAAFVEGLRHLYRTQAFRHAGFGEVQASFEAASGRGLGAFFEQWVQRPGAPRLRLEDVRVARMDTGYRVRGRLRQVQPGPPLRLEVPVAVQVAGETYAAEQTVRLDGAASAFSLALPAAPQRIAVDPRFDLFRRLDPAELPPSFGRLFAAQNRVFVLPAGAAPALREGYRRLAEAWAGSGDRVVWDRALASLPEAEAVWIFGRENRFRPEVERAAARHAPASAEGSTKGSTKGSTRGAQAGAGGGAAGGLPPDGDAAPLVAAAVGGGGGPILGWVGAAEPAPLAALARKLPHYGRYGYAEFAGPEAENLARREWAAGDSPLQVPLQPSAPPLRLRPRPPLDAALAQPADD